MILNKKNIVEFINTNLYNLKEEYKYIEDEYEKGLFESQNSIYEKLTKLIANNKFNKQVVVDFIQKELYNKLKLFRRANDTNYDFGYYYGFSGCLKKFQQNFEELKELSCEKK